MFRLNWIVEERSGTNHSEAVLDLSSGLRWFSGKGFVKLLRELLESRFGISTADIRHHHESEICSRPEDRGR
jgi:hypothetical protein